MRIRVTGYTEIEDDEYDSGPNGPLTEDAYVELCIEFQLDDIEFTVAEEED